jgi:hypothetical protein
MFAEQVLAAGEETGERALVLMAHANTGLSKFYQGRLRAALAHTEHVIACYDLSFDRMDEVTYGSYRDEIGFNQVRVDRCNAPNARWRHFWVRIPPAPAISGSDVCPTQSRDGLSYAASLALRGS